MMSTLSVKQIVAEYLENEGYDGLCTDGCGCGAGDLIPCLDGIERCRAAYRYDCDTCAFPYDPDDQWGCDKEEGGWCYRSDRPGR